MGDTRVRWLVALSVLPALAACGDAAGPEQVEVYELVEVAGNPLPATLEDSPGFFRTFVSDVIRIRGDGRWDRIRELRVRRPDQDEEGLTLISAGTVVPDGNAVVLSYECRDNASCVAPDRLRFVPGGAVIEWAVTPDSVLVWRYTLAPDDGG